MRRRLGSSLLLSFPVVTGVLIVAWALVTQPLLLRAPKAATVNIDPARLEVHVRMLSDTLVPRHESHPYMLDRAAAYVRREFEQAGGTVSEQPYNVDGKTYRNVIALFGPDTAERIVVGAHYDSQEKSGVSDRYHEGFSRRGNPG
jgi:acetylornithine deacetylase/succinyl-diaminopimelate desuccinylase-like protein